VFRLSKEVRSRAPTRREEVKCSSEEKYLQWKYGVGEETSQVKIWNGRRNRGGTVHSKLGMDCD